jgi:hypothetical protein
MEEGDAWEWAGDPEGLFPARWRTVQPGWFQVSGCPELLALEQYELTDDAEREMRW